MQMVVAHSWVTLLLLVGPVAEDQDEMPMLDIVALLLYSD